MTTQVNRRNFIKLSAAAGAGLTILPAASQASTLAPMKSDMPIRSLGRTGIKLPILSMGVMKADNVAVVKVAYQSGIYMFDTANGYQQGRNEIMLGNFFKDKPRDSFILATKVKTKISDSDCAAKFVERFEESMKRLQLKYVDILYFHSVTAEEEVNHSEVLAAMLKMKQDGRVKHIGVSTHSNEPVVINAAVANGKYEVILSSYNFSQKHHDELNPAIERAVKAGLGIVAMKTMAGGKANVPAALHWAWQNENITTAIPGFTSLEQLDECLAAVAKPAFTDDDKKMLAMLGDGECLYCQGCRKCESQCPRHLPIPEMMRAYMYNYGYHSPLLAKETLAELELSDNPCGDCRECTVKCTNHFAVAEKINNIRRLQAVPYEFLV